MNKQNNSLFVLDKQTTSFLNLYALAKEFVETKDETSKFKDFFAGGVGTTVMQLLAGFSEYNAYQAISSRRESYLSEVQQDSSAIGIASTLGYSVNRGRNVHLQITFMPMVDSIVTEYSIVGSVGEYDIVSLENKTFKYGYKDSLLVVLGKLKREALTIYGSTTQSFRFTSDKVSEDVQLNLNTTPVPYSRNILDILEDKYVTMSNPSGAVDVMYLNRFPPENWVSNTRYTFYSYILPNYRYRNDFEYKVGDYCCATSDNSLTPMVYQCTKGGTTVSEPEWNTNYGSNTQNGELRWQNFGKLLNPRFFRSVTPGTADSKGKEPVWPIEIHSRVSDGDIDWLCVDTYMVSKWAYNTGDILDLTYIELDNVSFTASDLKFDLGVTAEVTVDSTFQNKETIDSIQNNAPLYHETKFVIRGREDYRKIFKEIVPSAVDTNCTDKSPAVVLLSYVKEHTNRLWEPDMLVTAGDLIMPSSPNNYIYRAMTSGRSGLSTKGKSGEFIPDWNVNLGSKTIDNQLVWERITNVVTIAKEWKPKTEYSIKDVIEATDALHQFRLVQVATEPTWNTVLGSDAIDNEIKWACVDTIFFDGYVASYRVHDTQYKVGDLVQPVISNNYLYKCISAGYTSGFEPNWPISLADTVQDGTVVWKCFDTLDSPKYVKNLALNSLASYRPFGVEPPEIVDPHMVCVDITVELEVTDIRDLQSVKRDVDTILKEYQNKLGISVATQDLENGLEQALDYVRIARIKLIKDSKMEKWKAGTLYSKGASVVPTVANGFFYTANAFITSGTSGYSSWEDRATSMFVEPNFPKELGLTVNDGLLTWKIINRPSIVLAEPWKPVNMYLKNSVCYPNSVTNYLAQVDSINFHEPEWPTAHNKAVLDHQIYWVAKSLETDVVSLCWNEYYTFNRTIVVKKV